jgi:hypothetical protein
VAGVDLTKVAGLCPDNRVSGGKVLKRGTREVVNRAATALRLAACNLIRRQSALGPVSVASGVNLGAPSGHSNGSQAGQTRVLPAEIRC